MSRLWIFVVAISLLLPSVASAQTAPATKYYEHKNTASTNEYNLLEGVALNAAAASRTITLTLKKKWSKTRVSVFFTRTAATTVTALMSCSIDGTNYAPVQARRIASGVATLNDLVDTKNVSGNDIFMAEYDVRGCQKAQVLFGGAGAGGSDTVNVQAVSVVGN